MKLLTQEVLSRLPSSGRRRYAAACSRARVFPGAGLPCPRGFGLVFGSWMTEFPTHPLVMPEPPGPNLAEAYFFFFGVWARSDAMGPRSLFGVFGLRRSLPACEAVRLEVGIIPHCTPPGYF